MVSGSVTLRSGDYIMQEDWNITISILDCPDKSAIGQQKVFVTSPISIGRADNNDMIIPDPAVSRNHSILRITNDYTRVFITDMSTHGTEVSGKPVPKGRGTGFTIESGETIKMGDTLLRYELKLKPSVQSTFVGKIDKSLLDTPPELPSVTPEPAYVEESIEPAMTDNSRKGFSPLAIIIIVVCLAFMAYLIFFTK
jgi:predicted component of type VI protein secretion system